MKMQKHPQASIVIPSYNSAQVIEKCLTSVVEQLTTVPYEVIVADSSDDGTPRIIAERFPDVRLIHFEQKTIPPVARNKGIEMAQAEVIAFTDADCIVDKRWLESCLKAHGKGYDVVGGSIENARPYNIISIAEFFLEFREFSPHSRAREVPMVPTCNISVRRKVFDQAGKFPEIRASEDVLFSHFLTRKGIKILFDPDIRILHLNRNRLMPFLKNQWVLGMHFSVARRLAPIRGYQLVRFAPLMLLLPVVRFLRTLQFILQNKFPNNVRQLFIFALSLPFFVSGLMVFTAGAIRGRSAPITK